MASLARSVASGCQSPITAVRLVLTALHLTLPYLLHIGGLVGTMPCLSPSFIRWLHDLSALRW